MHLFMECPDADKHLRAYSNQGCNRGCAWYKWGTTFLLPAVWECDRLGDHQNHGQCLSLNRGARGLQIAKGFGELGDVGDLWQLTIDLGKR